MPWSDAAVNVRAGLLLLPLAACATDPHYEGPVPVRNQHPAQLTVQHMDPAGATPLGRANSTLRMDNAYSSLFLSGSGGGNSFAMDGEILRTSFRQGIGIADDLDLTVEIPFLYTTGGFLDSFLIEYHDLFNLPDQGRDTAPKDRFEVLATHQGSTAYQVKAHDLDLQDIPITLAWYPLPATRERGFGLGLRAGVELPIGDEEQGFGNGEFDFALGAVGEWRGPGFALTGHAQHTFAGSPKSAERAGTGFRDVTSLGVGIEWPWSNGFTVLVQSEWETSTLRDLGFARVADPHWLLWTGFRVRVSERVSLDATLGEDLNTYVSPDFTAFLGVAVRLGPSPGGR